MCWAADMWPPVAFSPLWIEHQGVIIEPRVKIVIRLPLTLQGLDRSCVLHTQRTKVLGCTYGLLSDSVPEVGPPTPSLQKTAIFGFRLHMQERPRALRLEWKQILVALVEAHWFYSTLPAVGTLSSTASSGLGNSLLQLAGLLSLYPSFFEVWCSKVWIDLRWLSGLVPGCGPEKEPEFPSSVSSLLTLQEVMNVVH